MIAVKQRCPSCKGPRWQRRMVTLEGFEVSGMGKDKKRTKRAEMRCPCPDEFHEEQPT